MKKWFIFLCLLLPVFGEEKKQEVVAYYLGVDVLQEDLAHLLGDRSGSLIRKGTQFPAVETWPFESRFIEDDDKGLDLTAWFRRNHETAENISIVFNQRSGRLIVKATPDEHLSFFSRRFEMRRYSFMISQRVEFFEFPSDVISKGQLNPFKVPEGARKLREFSQKVKDSMEIKVNVPDLSWEAEVSTGVAVQYVDCSFSLEGKIGEGDEAYDLKIQT